MNTMLLHTLMLTVWLDCMGSMMVQPLIPFLALKFGAAPSEIGFMQSFFSLMQVFGTFTIGKLADRFGESLVLRCCLLSSTVSLAAFGLSQNFTQLLFFRGLSGFFAGTLSVCQSMLVGMAKTPEERVNAMSQMGVVQGAGFCLGPGIGGLLSVYGFTTVAFTASGLTLLNFVMANFTLPSPEPDSGPESGKEGAGVEGKPMELIGILKAYPGLAVCYAASFLQSFGFSNMTSTQTLMYKDLYGYDGKEMGQVLFVAGMVMIVMQQLITKSAVKLLGEKTCLMIGCTARSASGYIVACFVAWWIPIIIPALNASGGALINPCLLSLSAAYAPSSARGIVMGALQSCGSFGMFLGPTVGGTLYAQAEWYPFMLAGTSQACVILLLGLFLKTPKTETSKSLIPKETGPPVVLTRQQSYIEYLNLEHNAGIFAGPELPAIPADFQPEPYKADHGPGYGFYGRRWLMN